MRFYVLERGMQIPRRPNQDAAYLIRDKWDDYGFKTQFLLMYLDAKGDTSEIGVVKIGQFRMGNGGSVDIPDFFHKLSQRHFSLGQDDSYYANLIELGPSKRQAILTDLNDIALDQDLFEKALLEQVTGKSLLRSVSVATVQNQFRRMATGGERTSDFSFKYVYPAKRTECRPAELSFEVRPNSQPPTNVHVVIGSNGVGKSYLLQNIARILVSEELDGSIGRITSYAPNDYISAPAENLFANVVSVAFSAFDNFEPLSTPQNRSTRILYKYIGLKRIPRSASEKKQTLPPKDISTLAQEFGASVSACIQQKRLRRWQRAMEMLESDPIFADSRVADIADSEFDEAHLRSDARQLFRDLSSGHKIVLLTMTRLVETLEERSLVLVDEPESHLHPPLLAAFIRALSYLLIDRNGVAIIATHSPVVLQEVPNNCVWKLRRFGEEVSAERPEIETFGENAGILTQEVFGLEITKSGFHKLLEESVSPGKTYDDVLNEFSAHLGSEARALLQAFVTTRDSESQP